MSNVNPSSILRTIGVLLLTQPLAAFAQFTEVSEAAGLSYVQHAPGPFAFCRVTGFTAFSCEPERMTGAAAAGDFDGDGWEDLAVSTFREGLILFRNKGDGTFEDVTEAAAIPYIEYTNNLAWADIEHDGDLDLLVGTTGGIRFYLFINNGLGVFTEEAVERGVAIQNVRTHLNWGIAFGDYNNDGWTDIYTTEWGTRLVNATAASQHGRLLRNRPNRPGYFEDVTEASGANLVAQTSSRGSFGFAPAIVDLDQDGHPDIAIAADFGTNTLFWSNGDGTFFNGTISAFVGDVENGMGSTFADYDMDGDLDWFVTSIYDPLGGCQSGCNWGFTGNRLYRKEAGRQFSDATDAAGVRDGAWGWGAAFFDYDNDGDHDLVMTNGFDIPSYGERLDQFRNDPMKFWINQGDGTYVESSQTLGTTDTRSGKGLLTFDYDRDGDLDLFIVNNASTPLLYRNDTPAGNHAFQMRFTRNGLPYDIRNAKVWITPREDGPVHYFETGVSTHFLGQSERVLHVGLGPEPPENIHRIEIEWPASKERTVIAEAAVLEEPIEIPLPAEQEPAKFHHADYLNCDWSISLSELLRMVQLMHFDHYQPSPTGEDGFGPASELPVQLEGHHDADYNPSDWQIELTELLRVVQLFNAERYETDPESEDGYKISMNPASNT